MYRTRAFTFSVPNRSKSGAEEGPSAAEPSINASTVPITQDKNNGNNNKSPRLSSFNCDGEVLEETELIVRTHCQLVQVFRSGIRSSDFRKDCCGLC